LSKRHADGISYIDHVELSEKGKMGMSYIPEPVFDEFLAELEMYCTHLDCVLKMLDEQELKIHEEYSRIQGDYDPESYDEGQVWYQAELNVLGKSTMFTPPFSKMGAIAGYCIVVFHLFERFLEEVCRLWGHSISEKFCCGEFIRLFPDFEVVPAASKINELGLLVNYSKHGKGRSQDQLAQIRPDYFRTTTLGFLPGTLKPLSGYHLEISRADFDNYANSIREFVKVMREQLG
jgi:hypothetical protein